MCTTSKKHEKWEKDEKSSLLCFYYCSSIPLRVWECSFLLQLLSAGFAGMLRHYKKGYGWNVEGVFLSGSGRAVNCISKDIVFFKRMFSFSLNILLCGKKLKFVRVRHGSRVGLGKDVFSDWCKFNGLLFLGVKLIAN